METSLKYQSGFGNFFSTEALPGTLPIGQNSPQQVAHGLYAEQINGSAFTAPRGENLRTWFYRIRPSVAHSPYKKAERGLWRSPPFDEVPPSPSQLRWDPLPIPKEPTDFLHGLVTLVGNDRAAVHLYVANAGMENRFFYNADGELMIVPQQGTLQIRTEMGEMEVGPTEIAVIPRGVKFQVNPRSGPVRGYVAENFGPAFRIPGLGPIGANGLAYPRDFEAPVAKYEDKTGDFLVFAKFEGALWSAPQNHSPLDVVGWHGNYTPYKYDLKRFQVIGSISFDHPDPSIFTVLTSPSDTPGVANLDFVLFAPRWLVADHTFRPPYYHRNCMSEYMGLINGVYDAKTGGGFVPGGGSLHNAYSAHGPDADTFEKASHSKQDPQHTGEGLAFMFESSRVFRPTAFAMSTPILQKDYLACWQGLKSQFRGPSPKGA